MLGTDMVRPSALMTMARNAVTQQTPKKPLGPAIDREPQKSNRKKRGRYSKRQTLSRPGSDKKQPGNQQGEIQDDRNDHQC